MRDAYATFARHNRVALSCCFGIGATLAHETRIEPLLGDALELAEQMELRLLTRVAPLRVQQTLGNVEQQRGWTHVTQMLERQIHALADDAGVSRDGRAAEVGAQFKNRIGV